MVNKNDEPAVYSMHVVFLLNAYRFLHFNAKDKAVSFTGLLWMLSGVRLDL